MTADLFHEKAARCLAFRHELSFPAIAFLIPSIGSVRQLGPSGAEMVGAGPLRTEPAARSYTPSGKLGVRLFIAQNANYFLGSVSQGL